MTAVPSTASDLRGSATWTAAGAAYALDGTLRLFVAESSPVLTVLTVFVATTSIVGELWLGVWFLVRGGRTR